MFIRNEVKIKLAVPSRIMEALSVQTPALILTTRLNQRTLHCHYSTGKHCSREMCCCNSENGIANTQYDTAYRVIERWSDAFCRFLRTSRPFHIFVMEYDAKVVGNSTTRSMKGEALDGITKRVISDTIRKTVKSQGPSYSLDLGTPNVVVFVLVNLHFNT